jgi:hypothetical protein
MTVTGGALAGRTDPSLRDGARCGGWLQEICVLGTTN